MLTLACARRLAFMHTCLSGVSTWYDHSARAPGVGLLLMLAGVCAFHLAVGNGRFEDLDSSSWDGLFGSEQCDGKQRDDDCMLQGGAATRSSGGLRR